MTGTWLVLGEGSPLRAFFLYHVTIPNIVGRLLVLPFLLLTVFRPASPWREIVGYGSEFIQWFVIAYLLSLIIWRARLGSGRSQDRQDPQI
jgi:hypothetical protein